MTQILIKYVYYFTVNRGHNKGYTVYQLRLKMFNLTIQQEAVV